MVLALGPRYTKPGCRRQKNQQLKYKEKIAMAVWLYCIHPEGSPSSLYSLCIYCELGFFFRLQSGLSTSSALDFNSDRCKLFKATTADRVFFLITDDCFYSGNLVVNCVSYNISLPKTVRVRFRNTTKR